MPERAFSVLVVGSINMDLVARVERMPLPGESATGRGYGYVPGGKGANQAVAAARLGARVTFVGRVGEDVHGSALRRGLEQEGVCVEFLSADPDSSTGLAVVVVDASGQNHIIVFMGANARLGRGEVSRAFQRDYDALIVNLEVSDEAVEEAVRLARDRGIPAVLDAGPARPFDLGRVRGLEILSPNETEATALTGMACGTAREARSAADALAAASGARFVVIKMGERGALLRGAEGTEFFPAHKVRPVDPTAAGDAFTAAMTLRYLACGDPAAAVRYANVAGAVTVTRLGAQPSLPTADEVDRFMRERQIAL